MQFKHDGLTLYYDLRGPEEAPPLLLIHGFPFSGEMWQPMCDLLDGDLRVINPDLRGLGRSEASHTATMSTYADDCVALLDAIGETRPVTVMGLSMGGYIAFEFFRRHRAKVRALIFADTRGSADTDEARKGRIATAKKVLADGSQVVANGMVEKLFSRSASPELKDHWLEVMSRSNARGVAAALLAMANRPDSTSTYLQIDVPTLILVGDEDVITPPEDSRIMHEAIADSRLVSIAGAGHLSAAERPGPFAAAVGAFIRSL